MEPVTIVTGLIMAASAVGQAVGGGRSAQKVAEAQKRVADAQGVFQDESRAHGLARGKEQLGARQKATRGAQRRSDILMGAQQEDLREQSERQDRGIQSNWLQGQRASGTDRLKRADRNINRLGLDNG